MLLLLVPVLMAMLPERRPRFAVAGFLHESNTFSTVPTSLADFERDIARGDAITRVHANAKNEVSGFLEGAQRFGFDVFPIVAAEATPGGPVRDSALNSITSEIIEKLRSAPKLDGLLLALHGAMVSESFPHADAEIVRRIRAAMGPEFPIVVTHDFHANIAPEIVAQSTVLVTYKTNPHVDQRERGVKAAEIASRMARGEVKPVQALAKPPMIYNIRFQNTNVEPLAPVTEESRRLEKQPGILAASVTGGYQYADVPEVGPAVVVVTDNDLELARREAQRLSDMLWATRDKLVLNLPDPAAAVREAARAEKFPVVLVEMGDNIGGGSAGDATFILRELVAQKAAGWVVAIADPEAVKAAERAGVGKPFDMPVGGKTDKLHGEPVRITGRVKALYDGKFLETEIRHGGQRYLDQGTTAVIEVEGSTRDLASYVMLTSYRQTPFSLHQLIGCGIYPQRQKILVVKAAIAFRAAYEPVAARIIEVDTGGVTAVNPARFKYTRARRPLFGLE
jgi:microcystin degradation protein MlrC